MENKLAEEVNNPVVASEMTQDADLLVGLIAEVFIERGVLDDLESNVTIPVSRCGAAPAVWTSAA
jgi:hypothetical protein